MRPPTRSPDAAGRPAALLCAAAALLLTACGSGNTPPATSSGAEAVTSARGADTADRAPARDRSAEEDRAAVYSRDPDAELVDRVAAVVGDTAVLLSEVREEILRARSQGLEVPSDPAARDSLMRRVLNNLIEERMLLQEARRSGITVGDAQLDQAVEQQFERIRSNFPSTEAFRKAVEETGQNMYQYRQMLRAEARKTLTIQRFIEQNQGRLPPIAVDEEEVRKRYEEAWADRSRTATVSVAELRVHPTPTEAADDSALAVARRALSEIRSGTGFEVAARRYSDDGATRESGGEIGWLRRQDVAPSFAEAAWAAPPGRPVGPVRTMFGYHVIEVENTRGAERNVRHILVRPEITEADVEEARELARQLADSLRSGIPPETLVRDYGERGRVEEDRSSDVPVEEIGRRLGDTYARAIGQPQTGKVVGPFESSSGGPTTTFIVARVTEHQPGGSYSLAEVRDRIQEEIRRQKQMDRFLQRLRDDVYVNILL